MRTYRDAKLMAKSLRKSLADKGFDLTHGECLEVVSQEFGFDSWNVLSARIGSSDGIELEQPVPFIRMLDVDKAREFYLDFLGFSVDWEHRFEERMPLVLGISRSGASLFLTEHYGDGTPGVALHIPMRGLKDFHAELISKNYPYARPGIEEGPVGGFEVCIGDPFGNQLRFNENP